MIRLKNTEVYKYFVFGVLTTFVYFFSRFAFLEFSNNSLNAAVFSQLVAIFFAFVTNKVYVFKNSEWSIHILLHQFFIFFSGRIFVFSLDLGLTYLILVLYKEYILNLINLVSLESYECFFCNKGKVLELSTVLFIQVIAIFSNYFISKFLVFRNPNGSKKT